MMKRGKYVCKTLKAIRKQVADANEIQYEPTECTYEGDCLGTCPKCEQEVRYIERQLNIRRALGKAVSVAGVAMGLGLSAAPVQSLAQESYVKDADSTTVEAFREVKIVSLLKKGEQGIVVRGRVIIAEDKEPGIGASIIRKHSKKGTVTNTEGIFAIEVPVGCEIEVAYIGMKRVTFTVTEGMSNIEVVLENDEDVLFDEVTVGVVCRDSYDDVYRLY